MKVVIVGAAGYLGGRLTEYLSSIGYHVIAVVRSLPASNESWESLASQIILGDIRADETVSKIADCQADTIINTVSLNHHLSGKNIEETLAINTEPTWKFLDLLSKQKGHYIYFSTQQVYGKTGGPRCSVLPKQSSQTILDSKQHDFLNPLQ